MPLAPGSDGPIQVLEPSCTRTDLLFHDGWVRVHEGSSTWIGPSEPGASGTVEFRYAPAAMLRLLGRLDEPHSVA